MTLSQTDAESSAATLRTADCWSIEVSPRAREYDVTGFRVLDEIHEIGLTHVTCVRSSVVYLLKGNLAAATVGNLAEELFVDAVVEQCVVGGGPAFRTVGEAFIEVQGRPGVMNPAALSALAAAREWLTARGESAILEALQTARRYEILGTRNAEELEQVARRLLANDCIESFSIQGHDRRDPLPAAFPEPPLMPFALRHVPICTLDAAALARLSREGHLFLSVEEMRAIQSHFVALGREPTDLELETLAQTWSEHCVHKTLKSAVVYTGEDFGRPGTLTVTFDNLLKDTIVRATRELNRDWCLSVFVDNAGVVAFDEEFGVAFKVETHNHPSAIEPYGGAATGVGGCIRDIMGCGLGARPIASTDVFCLAPPGFDADRLPEGVLHPRRVLRGVVAGVRDYGNRMGIPTVNGAICFDEQYLANPLVFCGCVGLIPRRFIEKGAQVGDLIVLAGGRTGRDGIHGATFSSAELTDTHADEFSHAVQIGHAINQKKLLDALLLARDHPAGCLHSAVTDCGAGGLSSAVGEMGAALGAEVDLEKVPLKYAGLRYDEIWISEAQERMVFAVPSERLADFLRTFADEEVEAVVIGRFTGDHKLRVRFEGTLVGELDMHFLHEGLPRTVRQARWTRTSVSHPTQSTEDGLDSPTDLSKRLFSALGSLNVASREWVIRQYDHEVQGRSVVKPLVGRCSGPSDAAVLRPRLDSCRGIALACGLQPELSRIDPYRMAIAAVDEALRNVICVGGDPLQTAILDNFCWAKVDTEERLGALVRACRGAMDAALAYGLPFISGKDSLNNEFFQSEADARRLGLPVRMAIPDTLLISALSIVADVCNAVTMDLKQPGHVLVMASAPVEQVGLEKADLLHRRVAEHMRAGTVFAAHDVSDGGLAVTIAEMCIASGYGAVLEMDTIGSDAAWFEQVGTTYVLEMEQSAARAAGLPIIGRVEASPRMILCRSGGAVADVAVRDLDVAWRTPLARGG